MNSKVVEEVASFSKFFPAPRIITLKDPSNTFGLFVFELYYFKSICVRYVFAFANIMETF